MNGPLFFSRPYQLFSLLFFTDVNTFKRKSSKFLKLPIFSFEDVSFFETEISNAKRDKNLMVKSFR